MRQDLLATLDSRLTDADRGVVATLLEIAGRRGEQLYLVGGSVRDLLLGRQHVDLDISVEDDAIGLARELAESRGERLTVHTAFGTASVEFATSRVDLAQSRAESYERPGALPTVRPASIEEDLRRRDFTVNAMALRLTPPNAGELLDPCGGRRDLEQRLIRVLHEGSFRDDATRMLRAVRYEGRLSFRLDEETARLLRRDLAYLGAISGARLRAEIIAIFYEDKPQTLLARCQELGILAAIHPCLQLDGAGEAALARAQAVPTGRQEERPAPWDEVCLCLLCLRCEEEDVGPLVHRLALPKRYERALADYVRLRKLLPALASPEAPPSKLTEMMEPITPAPLWAMALRADDPVIGERLRLFLREWRYVKPFLGASALRRLGIPAGPEFGALLRRLRAARLDGLTGSREDELELLGRQPVDRREG